MRTLKLVSVLASSLALAACADVSNGDKKAASSSEKVEDFRAYVADVCPNDPKKDTAVVKALSDEFRTLAASYVDVQKLRQVTTRAAEALLRQQRSIGTALDAQIAATEAARKKADDDSAMFIRYMRAISSRKIASEIDGLQRRADEIESDFTMLRNRIARRNDLQTAAARHAEETKIDSALQAIESNITALDGTLTGGPQIALAPVAAALIAAVLPSLIDASLDLVAGALHEAAKDKSIVQTAMTTAYLHTVPPPQNSMAPPFLTNATDLGCVILAKGKFSGPTPTATDKDIYIEATIERSNDRTAFRLIPVYARINKYDSNGFFGGNKPEIAVSVALHAARAGKESAPIALTMFALPIVDAPREMKAAALQERASYWTAYPAPDAAAKARLERLSAAQKRVSEAEAAKTVADCDAQVKALWVDIPKFASWDPDKVKSCPEAQESILRAVLETQAKKDTAADAARFAAAATIADLKKRAIAAKEIADDLDNRTKAYLGAFTNPINLTPVSIEVQLIESRKGSPFLQAVANALDKSKKDISTALVQELSPVERAKRRAEEEQQTRTNRAAVATAEDNVRLKQAELDDLPATATRAERVRAENALRQAKIAANNAYLADGRGVPYPEVQP
jgi:hypothetical protein